MRKGFTKKGFTLIELSLSVAFIGIMSISIALIISDTVATYRRGMVLNQVNTTGMDLVDELRAAVQNSSASSVKGICEKVFSDETKKTACETDFGKNFVVVRRLATVDTRTGTSQEDSKEKDLPVFGAFCTGTYSFIWNSGYFFSDDYKVTLTSNGAKLNPASFVYRDGSGTVMEKTNFRMLKVKDEKRHVCMGAVSDIINNDNLGQYNLTSNSPLNTRNKFDISAEGFMSVVEEPIEVLLSDSNNTMALYDLNAEAPAQGETENELFYSVSFILATITGGIDIKATGNYCATPEDYAVENLDYCAINKFNFAVRATGESI